MRRNTEPLETIRDPFMVKSEDGMTIVGLVERALDTPQAAPVVIITPTYGKTIRDYFMISWYLLQHGFRVVRYDNTCHIGASHGDIWHFTLRSAIADLLAVTRYVTETVRPPSWGVVAPSLAFRVAIRAFCGYGDATSSSYGDASLLFSLVGVVNFRYTLYQVIEVDLFQEHEEDRLPPDYEVLGHVVGAPFITTAAEDDLVTLESTIADLRRCAFPIVHVAGEDDPWVRLENVEKAYAEDGHSQAHRLFYLPAVHHNLAKNPVAAALAMQQMVIACSQYVGHQPIEADDVVHPNLLEIVRVNKLEKSLDKKGYRAT